MTGPRSLPQDGVPPQPGMGGGIPGQGYPQPGMGYPQPGMGYPLARDRTVDGVFDTPWAICLLCSHRRTFLFRICVVQRDTKLQ